MPRKLRIVRTCLFAVMLVACAAAAHAAVLKGVYFAGYMGLKVEKPGLQFSSAPKGAFIPAGKSENFAGALGFKLAPRWRMEGELNYRGDAQPGFSESETPDTGGFKSWTGLVNVYYDFDVPGKVKPFVGGGVGYASQQAGGLGETGNFAWQVGGGLNYSFNPSLSFSSAYRFIDGGAVGFDSQQQSGDHEFRIGLTYKIPLKKQHHGRGLNDPD